MTSRLNSCWIELAGVAFEQELERRPDQFPGFDVTAAKAGGKSGRRAHLMAGVRRRLDVEGAVGLAGDGDLRHAVTLASPHSMHGRPTMTDHGPPLLPTRTSGNHCADPGCGILEGGLRMQGGAAEHGGGRARAGFSPA